MMTRKIAKEASKSRQMLSQWRDDIAEIPPYVRKELVQQWGEDTIEKLDGILAQLTASHNLLEASLIYTGKRSSSTQTLFTIIEMNVIHLGWDYAKQWNRMRGTCKTARRISLELEARERQTRVTRKPGPHVSILNKILRLHLSGAVHLFFANYLQGRRAAIEDEIPGCFDVDATPNRQNSMSFSLVFFEGGFRDEFQYERDPDESFVVELIVQILGGQFVGLYDEKVPIITPPLLVY